MFGAQPGHFSNVVPFIDIDGKAAYGGSDVEAMEAGLTMLQDMYQKGYISQDFITVGGDQINQELAAGKSGMLFSYTTAPFRPWASLLETQPEANFVSCIIPGLTADQRGQSFYTAIPQEYYTLSSKCDNIEAFFEMANLGAHYLTAPKNLSQEEYEKYNGLPGQYSGFNVCLTPFAVPDKNVINWAVMQEVLDTGETSNMTPENLRDYNSMMEFCNNRDRRAELNEEELAKFNAGLLYWCVFGNEHCTYQTLTETAELGNFLYSAYDTAPTVKMNEYTTTLNTLTKETIVNIITGNKSVSEYESFLENWYSLGGQEITEEADAWYQASKGN
jgi:putative aldouronate transport system substrate-binding protein